MDTTESSQQSTPSDTLQNPASVLSPTFDNSQIRQVPIIVKNSNFSLRHSANKSTKLAFLLKNVFTPQECRDLITLSEKSGAGYGPALLNVGGGNEILETRVRKSSRIIFDDVQFAQILMSRIAKFIPQQFQGAQVAGINERLRFLRYDPGDIFHMHQDGAYVRPNGAERSMITLQIYLNEGFSGGETTFGSVGKCKEIPIVPEEGMILVFQHNITHEGSELKAGRKYTVRTEVMYTN